MDKRMLTTSLLLCLLVASIFLFLVGCLMYTPPKSQPQTQTSETKEAEIGTQADNHIEGITSGKTPEMGIQSLNDDPKEEVTLPKEKMIDIPIIKQKPELYNGCEVTSLTMLLQFAGFDVDKMKLYEQMKKDPTPLVQKGSDIVEWGDPNFGFVGDMTGKKKGFGVYNGPLEELMREYLGDKTVNLTGKSLDDLISSIAQDKPVVVWATGDFTKPTEWATWQKDGKEITVPFDEHVVLAVGYDDNYIYVNNPLNGMKQQKITREAFSLSWEAMGKQALTYK